MASGFQTKYGEISTENMPAGGASTYWERRVRLKKEAAALRKKAELLGRRTPAPFEKERTMAQATEMYQYVYAIKSLEAGVRPAEGVMHRLPRQRQSELYRTARKTKTSHAKPPCNENYYVDLAHRPNAAAVIIQHLPAEPIKKNRRVK